MQASVFSEATEKFAMLKLSEDFTSNIIDVHGQKGRSWLMDLPNLTAAIASEWELDSLEPFDNLTYAFVAKVRTKNGQAVLKLSPPCSRTAREITWYHHQKKGCARLLRWDSNTGALLLERLNPGVSLKQKVIDGNDDEATMIIAKTIIELVQPVESDINDFPHVKDFENSLKLLHQKIDHELYRVALNKFHALIGAKFEPHLLHGDLHHDNILSDGDSFKAIDPHGYVGPAAFEVGAMIRNPYDAFPKALSLKETIERRITILANALPFRRDEILAWSLIYTLIATSWSLEDHGEIPKEHLDIATILCSLSLSPRP